MAYFNNAFYKTFVASSVDAVAGTSTIALAAGEIGLVEDKTWQTMAIPGAVIPPSSLAYLVQGSFYTKDTIGNNPGNGGYKESVKSKGINPKFISRVWAVEANAPVQATATLGLGSSCVPCGTTQFMRMDVKGSPALRFLNHNAYAIGDSAGICCAEGQEFLDPALVLATEAYMILGDPLIKPFVAEKDVDGVQDDAGNVLAGGTGYVDASNVAATGGSGSGASFNVVQAAGVITSLVVSAPGIGYKAGDVLTITGGNADATITLAAGGVSAGGVVVSVTDAAGEVVGTVYTIAQAKGTAASGNYTPSLTPNAVGAKVSATVTWVGAYVDTKFGNCSFDTRDHYDAEPVEIIASILDETGNPCNDCGDASRTPGQMQQTQGEEVIRALILSERYRQSPYNQGNADSARIREIEMSDELLAAVDRSAVYKAYYVQHTVPRYNNPSGVFDNDQYVYQIFVKDTDAAAKVAMDALALQLVTLANAAGNNIQVETGF